MFCSKSDNSYNSFANESLGILLISFGSSVKVIFVLLLLITNGESEGKSPEGFCFSSQTGILAPEILGVVTVHNGSGKDGLYCDHRKLVICVPCAVLHFS